MLFFVPKKELPLFSETTPKKSLLAIMQKKKLLLLYNQEAVWQLQQGTTKGGHSNERHE